MILTFFNILSCSQVKIEDSQTRMEKTQLNIQHSLRGMQENLNDILCLQRRDSTFLPPFTGSINSRKAFKELCRKLYQIGVRGDTIVRKETQVLELFRRGSIAISQAFDIAVEKEGQPQTTNERATTVSPTSAHNISSRNAIRFCMFCLCLGVVLAGAWIAGFFLENFTRLRE